MDLFYDNLNGDSLFINNIYFNKKTMVLTFYLFDFILKKGTILFFLLFHAL